MLLLWLALLVLVTVALLVWFMVRFTVFCVVLVFWMIDAGGVIYVMYVVLNGPFCLGRDSSTTVCPLRNAAAAAAAGLWALGVLRCRFRNDSRGGVLRQPSSCRCC